MDAAGVQLEAETPRCGLSMWTGGLGRRTAPTSVLWRGRGDRAGPEGENAYLWATIGRSSMWNALSGTTGSASRPSSRMQAAITRMASDREQLHGLCRISRTGDPGGDPVVPKLRRQR